MKKRLVWGSTLLIVISVIAVVLFVLYPKEPTYQGKPVSFWFHQYVFSLSPTREETLESVAEIGSEAIPYLARMLRKKESWTGRTYRSQWPRLPEPVKRWLPRPIDPARRHVDAMACLSRLSLSFNTAIPPLIEALDDPDLRIPAIHALGQIASTGPGSGRIAAALGSAAQDASPFVRQEAIRALFWVGHLALDDTELRLAVSGLIKALDSSENPPVRLGTVAALRQIGPAANEAVPALRTWFEDPNTDHETKLQVASAWLEIDPGSATNALEYLIANKFKTWEPNLSRGVPSFFAKARWSAQTAVPSLIALLRGDTESQCSAALALGRIGSLAIEAVPALRSNLEADEPVVRLISALALQQIDPGQGQAAVAVLSNLLKHVTYGVDAASALANMGPTAHTAVPTLLQTLEHEWPYFREVAGQALCRIDPSQKSRVVPVFLELLSRKDITYSSRLSIVEALGNTGQEAHATVPILTEHLKHRDRRIRLAAAEALWKIDEHQIQRVVSFLIGYLESKDCWYREIAAELLGKIGPAASAAVPALRRAANDEDKTLRARAMESLRAIELGAVGQGGRN